MNISRYISTTSPLGMWSYNDLLGATVKIRHLAVGRGLFAYDNDTTYTIEDIKFRMTSEGLSIGQVYLKDEPNPFEWKDLEIIGLNMAIYGDAICGTFCVGGTLCGCGYESNDEETDKATSPNKCSCCTDGPVLD